MLQDVNLKILGGKMTALVGHSGAGKSTLVKLLAGKFIPTKGEIDTSGDIYSMLPGSVRFIW